MLIVSRLSWQGYNIEDTINKIFQVCWLFISGDGEENGYVVGGWHGQMLWGAEMIEDLYEAMTESDLTKTQNSWVNNEQTNFQQLHI